MATKKPAEAAHARPGDAACGNAETATEPSRLEAVGICKSFKSRKVVDSVSLHVDGGEVVGLLGANGAGKTTSFNIIVGLEIGDEGSVMLDGTDISHMPLHLRAKKGIGYLPQEPSVFRKLTVKENIFAVLEMQAHLSGEEREERQERLLETFGINPIRDALGVSLSGGERRRVEIARAFATNPRFILLDEPFAGVDPIAIEDVVQQIRYLQGAGIGILITDHNVRETMAICDRAYIMSHGKVIVAGKVAEILKNPAAKRHYLGNDFRL